MPDNPSSAASSNENPIPPATANRLGIYLRELQQLSRSGVLKISSRELGERLGLSDSQIRRDLAIFGQFGRRGVGYSVDELSENIRTILGTDRTWGVILVGTGNLGTALAGYRGFHTHGFRLLAAFDQDTHKVGRSVGQVFIHAIDDLEKIVGQLDVQLAILAVPSDTANALTHRLNRCGIQGVLNFAPVTVQPPPGMTVVDVDLALELQRLVFAVVSGKRSG